MNAALAWRRERHDSIKKRGVEDRFLQNEVDPNGVVGDRSHYVSFNPRRSVPQQLKLRHQNGGEIGMVAQFPLARKGGEVEGKPNSVRVRVRTRRGAACSTYLTDRLTPLRTGGKSGLCLAYTSRISRPLEGHGLLVAGPRPPLCPWKNSAGVVWGGGGAF